VDRQEIVAAVTSAISEVLEREVTGVSEESRLFEDIHLDSTSIMELLMSLEDSVNISVDPEALEIDDFKSVGALADYVERELAAFGARRV
jgi:acyl carrier protein